MGLKAVVTSAMVPPFPQVTAAMVPLTTACKEVLREARSGLANHRARKGSSLLVTTIVAPGAAACPSLSSWPRLAANVRTAA